MSTIKATKVQARRWCWTLNNYSETEEKAIQNGANDAAVRYVLYGHETAPETKTPHLQGYIELNKALTMNGVKRVLGSERVHVEKCKGTASQNIQYCKKEKNFWEHGESAKGASKVDYNEIVNECIEGKSLAEIFSAHPEEAIKNAANIKGIQGILAEEKATATRKARWDDFKLTSWEEEVLHDLQNQNENRKIIWVLDTKGGCGKSTFSDYLEDCHDAFVWNAGVVFKDVAKALGDLQRKPKIVVFDLTRQRQEHIDYSIMEAITRGRICSGKYDSHKIYFDWNVRVVCMANWEPEYMAMSADRWDVRELNGMFKPCVHRKPHELLLSSVLAPEELESIIANNM